MSSKCCDLYIYVVLMLCICHELHIYYVFKLDANPEIATVPLILLSSVCCHIKILKTHQTDSSLHSKRQWSVNMWLKHPSKCFGYKNLEPGILDELVCCQILDQPLKTHYEHFWCVCLWFKPYMLQLLSVTSKLWSSTI